MLRTLETLGYVHREGLKFQLTPRVLDLANVYLSTMPLGSLAEPVMEKMVGVVNETCSTAVLDGTEIVYVGIAPANRIMAISLSVGSRLPAYCTSQGRVLLGSLSRAELNQLLKESNLRKHTRYTITSISQLVRVIRRDYLRGWSLANQEVEEGICSISVPIAQPNGRVVAAISVASSLSRVTAKRMISMVLPHLKQAAQEVQSLLSGAPLSASGRKHVLDRAAHTTRMLGARRATF